MFVSTSGSNKKAASAVMRIQEWLCQCLEERGGETMKIGIASGDERISHCPGGRLNTMQLVGWVVWTRLYYYEKQQEQNRRAKSLH